MKTTAPPGVDLFVLRKLHSDLLQYKCGTRLFLAFVGVSGEKVEVDPVQGKGILFKHKANTLEMEDIVSCTLLDKERPSGKDSFSKTIKAY